MVVCGGRAVRCGCWRLMRKSRTTIIILFTALVWGLAGCTRIGGGTPPVTGAPPAGTGAPAQATATAGYSTARDDLPFSPYAGVIHKFTAEDEADDSALKQRVDETGAFMAECMRERGFVYYPEPLILNEPHPGWFVGISVKCELVIWTSRSCVNGKVSAWTTCLG